MTTSLFTSTPPLRNSSERVPNTEWVHNILSYADSPRVGQDTLLSINISRGRVRKGNCHNPTEEWYFTDGARSVGLAAPGTEYVWLRYSDSQLVVTQSLPDRDIAHLIAIVTTNSERITSIENYDGWDCPPSVLCDCVDNAGGTGGTENIINSLMTLSTNTPNTLFATEGQLWITIGSSYKILWVFYSGGWHVIGGTPILNYGSPSGGGVYPGQMHYNIASGIMSIYIEDEWRALLNE